MTDNDYTLTSPLSDLATRSAPLLAMTIIWHADRSRIGEQFVGGAAGGVIALSRYAPLFMHPGADALALGHSAISRQPLRLVRDADDHVTMTLPASAMVVEVNGTVVKDVIGFDAAQISAGQIVTLGRAVVLCLHWMDRLPTLNAVPGWIGVGSAAIAVREQIRLVAPSGLPVLLLGETGTGKEIAARAIHALSARAAASLVSVNMAALQPAQAALELFGTMAGAQDGAPPNGLFAEADGATLFLDEIGNAPAAVQPMLLRVLEGGDYRPLGAVQQRQASARVIAATDQDLQAATFNQALLRRLEGFVILMPPLRARREDIGVLIQHLLAAQGVAADLPAALVAALAAYDWPGNVRQLAQALRRAVLILGKQSAPTLEQLVRTAPAQPDSGATPPSVPGSVTGQARRRLGSLSAQQIVEAMADNAWNIQAAAQALGVSRPSMYKLLDDHPVIRRAESIPEQEIVDAMAASKDDLTQCAALLQTPAEALRRRWRLLRVGRGRDQLEPTSSSGSGRK